MRILFVDDDPLILRALLLSFAHLDGWRIQTAEGGAAGILALERMAFDVVVTDMRMDDVDGAVVLAAAKRTNPAAARIVLTALDVGRAVIDADLVVMKPCTAEYLYGSIVKAVRYG